MILVYKLKNLERNFGQKLRGSTYIWTLYNRLKISIKLGLKAGMDVHVKINEKCPHPWILPNNTTDRKNERPAAEFLLHERISAVACVGCHLKTARHIRVKFGRPLVDSSLEVHIKFRRDPFCRFRFGERRFKLLSHKWKAIGLSILYSDTR